MSRFMDRMKLRGFSILGAAALGDIGAHFPPSDARYRDADSRDLLRESARLARDMDERPLVWTVVSFVGLGLLLAFAPSHLRVGRRELVYLLAFYLNPIVALGGLLDEFLDEGGERRIECACKVWAAGVQASSLGKLIAEQSDGTEIDRAGRVIVEPDLTVKGHPDVFVVGDLMFVPGVPGVAQGAIQGARYATKVIKNTVADLRSKTEPVAADAKSKSDDEEKK